MELDATGLRIIEEMAQAWYNTVSFDTRVSRQGVRVNPTACYRCACRPPRV